MRQFKLTAIAAAAAVATIAIGPAAHARGTPQRSPEPPAGLLKVLAKQTPGILRALVATEGSNSRLQDLAVSP